MNLYIKQIDILNIQIDRASGNTKYPDWFDESNEWTVKASLLHHNANK